MKRMNKQEKKIKYNVANKSESKKCRKKLLKM